MSGALGWGLLAGSAFVVGGLLVLTVDVSQRVLGLLMGFGAGSLIAAVAYELIDEAGRRAAGTGRIGIGLLAGSAIYVVLVGRQLGVGQPGRSPDVGELTAALAFTVVPEAIIIVGSLLAGHGINVAVVTAVFLCGVPEAVAGTHRLKAAGISAQRIMAVWVALALLCGGVAAIAYRLLRPAPQGAVALVLALAAGALLAELATELIPRGHDLAGAFVGTAVAVGFGLVFLLVEVA